MRFGPRNQRANRPRRALRKPFSTVFAQRTSESLYVTSQGDGRSHERACIGHPKGRMSAPNSDPAQRSKLYGDAREMNRRRKIYEGKAKVLYEGPEPGTLIQHFKDDATAGNGAKHEIIDGKGVLNNRISEFIFTKLNILGIPTHFVRRINMREQLIREVEIIPIEVVVRNVAAGSLCKRLGLESGTQLPRSIIEFYYK